MKTPTATLGLLGILFIGLKLTGYIAWSWWWVTAPFWSVPVTLIALFLVIGIVFLIAKILG